MGIVACVCAVAAVIASVQFLRTRQFQFDSVSVASVEVGLLFLAIALAAGSIQVHGTTGRWWNWNPPLTSALACGLLYCGYLILRHAVEEPTQRAVFCAVFSVFAFLDIPIVVWAVNRWCNLHPQPAMPFLTPSVQTAAFLLTAVVFTMLRTRKEELRRLADARRRAEQELY